VKARLLILKVSSRGRLSTELSCKSTLHNSRATTRTRRDATGEWNVFARELS